MWKVINKATGEKLTFKTQYEAEMAASDIMIAIGSAYIKLRGRTYTVCLNTTEARD